MRSDALGLFWQDMPKIKTVKDEVKYLQPERTWESANHLPYLDEAMLFPVELMTDQDLIYEQVNKHALIFDIECYINYFLIAFKSEVTGKVIYFEKIMDSMWGEIWNDDLNKLSWILQNCKLIGFNSNGYDWPLALMAILDKELGQMKAATNMIINEGYRSWQIIRKLKLPKFEADHIDIMEVAPVSGSLKIYGGRSGTRKMQDLPIHPDVYLTPEQIAVTRYYCVNDLDTTIDVKKKIENPLKMRDVLSAKYGLELRSKSDAQIAEAVIKSEIERITGRHATKPTINPGHSFYYHPPEWMEFQTPLMQNVLKIITESLFVVNEKGAIGLPPQIAGLKIRIGDSVYKMGIGGLHSTEKTACHIATEGYKIKEKDVTSYYPFIILNNQYYPEHLGRVFLDVYGNIVFTRLDAKALVPKLEKQLETAPPQEISFIKEKLQRANDDAQGLKIVINGAFGKLGSAHSILYSPNLLIQTTITGQLSLLLLIEAMELNGISVISANTDGIVVKCTDAKSQLVDDICEQWEKITNFNLEGGEYKVYASASVNNYFAVTPKGKVKRKGVYAEPNLSKNPTTPICSNAVAEFLSKGTPLEETINNCTDPFLFTSIRSVKGGAVAVTYNDKGPSNKVSADEMREHLVRTGWIEKVSWDNRSEWCKKPEDKPLSTRDAYSKARFEPIDHEYLGKAIRWYYSKPVDEYFWMIMYASNGNKVPKSDYAKPLMELDGTIPDDLDRDWYIREAEQILIDIGYNEKPKKK